MHSTFPLIDGRMFIGGRWSSGAAEGWIDVHSPATEELVGRVPAGTAADAEAALAAARAAQPGWAALPPIERARHLRRLARLIERDREIIATLVTREQGKPLAHARGEVDACVGLISFAADSARFIEGEIIPSDISGEELWLRRVPYGVAVGLTAWNFPIALAGRKLGPALVAGNTMVMKAHELTPLALLEIGRLTEEAGLPPGVFNIVTGGRTVGEALVASPHSDLVTLTGSVRAGGEIQRATAGSFKAIRLELGGKAPFIVMADADLEAAVEAAVSSRFFNCGQVCTCNERMYLDRRIADRFIERFLARVAALRVGDPLGDVDMGPKISRAERDKVAAMVDAAVAGGAELLAGGRAPAGEGFARGHWYEPTVLLATDNSSPIMQEEIFGPVVPYLEVADFDEALRLANQSAYGLSAYLFTRDLTNVMRFNRESAFGELYINRGAGELVQGFHSGWKQSGLGGEDGRHGLDNYLRKKLAYVRA
ncbi:aldehyde dehydrogenase [Devosia insulae DS-56]|uniref:Aldehyde dehydrogenase n=1 Tax=Devosia insulae DS-56 TaxID=1116389 RepID=A0A1E5XUM4_9HYPH|nr:aldehyde dehydrogenase family protein [Devosia insulae]OEO32291.1 aldehyde dehydrogenase [Devosia insulae DS-56]